MPYWNHTDELRRFPFVKSKTCFSFFHTSRLCIAPPDKKHIKSDAPTQKFANTGKKNHDILCRFRPIYSGHGAHVSDKAIVRHIRVFNLEDWCGRLFCGLCIHFQIIFKAVSSVPFHFETQKNQHSPVFYKFHVHFVCAVHFRKTRRAMQTSPLLNL